MDDSILKNLDSVALPFDVAQGRQLGMTKAQVVRFVIRPYHYRTIVILIESLFSIKSYEMGAIVIKADEQSSKILKELATKLGGDVIHINEEQYEDLMLGTLMERERKQARILPGQ